MGNNMKAKSKMRISKRILSFVLVIIMVLGMLPQTIKVKMTEASEKPYTQTVVASQKEYLNGWTITIDNVYYFNKSANKEYPLRVNYIIVRDDTSNLKGSELTYKITVKFIGCEDETISHGAVVEKTFSVDCTKNKSISGKYTSDPKDVTNLEFDYKFERKAGKHAGGTPTCAAAATCTSCGHSYYDEEKHSLSYSVSKNIITETCSNGCGHSATAKVTATDATYSESYITTASVDYTGDWKGGTLKPSYENNFSAGTATAKIAVKNVSAETTFAIKPRDIKETTIKMSPENIVYDGTWHAIPMIEPMYKDKSLSGTDYEIVPNYSNSLCRNPGTYKVADIKGKKNFTGTKEVFLTILPADLTNISVNQIGTIPYNGEAQKPEVSAKADTKGKQVATFTYSTSEKGSYSTELPSYTELGTYTVYYKVTAEFHKEASGSFQVTVGQGTNQWTKEPSIKGWTYGEKANVPTATAKFGTVDILYKGKANDGTNYNDKSAPTKAGNYNAVFTVEGTDKYQELKKEIPFTIEKASYDMSSASWDYEDAFYYDGKEKTVKVTGLPTGVTVSGYEDNEKTVVGNYAAKVSFHYDSDNYKAPVLDDLAWCIKNDWLPVNGIEYITTALNGGGWTNQNFEVKAADGYQISSTNNADGEWKDKWSFSDETADGKCEFYLRNTTNGRISLMATEKFKIDKTPATGKIAFTNGKKWEEFVDTITFDLFYKDEVTLKVTADDTLSGVANVEYYEADHAMNLEEVKVIDDAAWTSYNDSFAVSIEDTKQFVYFVRITDNAGNVIYLSTNGAEYDTTNPEISGAENEKIYYTTQKVTVTDKNMASITVNGEKRDTDITLDGNKDAIYSIVATDKAGNSTTITVTMKPINDLAVPIDTLTKDSVNSEDEQTLDEVKTAVEAVDTANATEDEKQALKDIVDKTENFKKVIEDTRTEIARINEELNKQDRDTVKSTDKDNMEQLVKDIDTLLEGNNLTEKEKKALEDAKIKVKNLLEVIENAAKAIDTENTEKVEDVNAENVTPENKTDLEKAKTDLEKALVDNDENYTEEEKKNIQEDIDRIDKALEVINKVENVEGLINKLPENITKNDKNAIKAAAEAYNALTDYEKSLVDEKTKNTLEDAKKTLEELNKPVPEDDGDLQDSDKSTNSSKPGNSNNQTSEKSRKTVDSNSPKTRDNSQLALWILLFFISGGAIIMLIAASRKGKWQA